MIRNGKTMRAYAAKLAPDHPNRIRTEYLCGLIDRITLARLVNQAFGTTTIMPWDVGDLPREYVDMVLEIVTFDPKKPPQSS